MVKNSRKLMSFRGRGTMSVKKGAKIAKGNSQLHGGNTHRDDCGRHARYQKQDQTHFYFFAGYILQRRQGTNRGPNAGQAAEGWHDGEYHSRLRVDQAAKPGD
jgi:hypothetical protein